MTLRRGDKSEAVKRVQMALRQFGFDIGVDGAFGKGTEAAVRQFQRDKGLSADGAVGPQTLRALGLDPDSLGDDQVDEIIFEPEDVDVPPIAQEKINRYIELLERNHNQLLDVARDALANFETTMSFASAQDANPAILETMLSAAFDFAVGQAVAALGETFSTPAAFVVEVYNATTTELERAGRASQSLKVGNWIKGQRVAIDRSRQGFNRDRLKEDLTLLYLEAGDRNAFFEGLVAVIGALGREIVPSVSELEQKLYEQWINAHFGTIGEDAPGCIEYRYEVEGNELELVSCTVEAPFGDKVAAALNRILDQQLTPAVKRPFDLSVRKRACFLVDNLTPGGRSWSCGWFDSDNQMVHAPILNDAAEVIGHKGWRMAANRFRN